MFHDAVAYTFLAVSALKKFATAVLLFVSALSSSVPKSLLSTSMEFAGSPLTGRSSNSFPVLY